MERVSVTSVTVKMSKPYKSLKRLSKLTNNTQFDKRGTDRPMGMPTGSKRPKERG